MAAIYAVSAERILGNKQDVPFPFVDIFVGTFVFTCSGLSVCDLDDCRFIERKVLAMNSRTI